MNKSAQTGLIIGIIIVALLVGGYFLFFTEKGSEENPTQNVPAPGFEDIDETIVINEDTTSESSEHTIEFTSEGYSPNTLTINKGDTVTFVNKEDKLTWPASAVHPTHTVYPNSDIKKCGTSEENNIFDACQGLQKDETYSFTFTEIGTWNYHDHLSAGKRGTITVQ